MQKATLGTEAWKSIYREQSTSRSSSLVRGAPGPMRLALIGGVSGVRSRPLRKRHVTCQSWAAARGTFQAWALTMSITSTRRTEKKG